ncbi:MAG: hypothetical protein N4A33_04800 [Bacteriovoracaceae bacterium]|jgi:hypothetical protein|nr:hypothetical protein [Bacteriovoracaceae bacterium]
MSITLDDMKVESAESTETTMDSETTESIESTEVEANGSELAEETIEAPEAESTEEEIIPEFEPDFSYEVKGEKKEFPEWIRESIKSKENEDELRDYFTKIDGFEGIKEARTKVEAEFNTYKKQMNPMFERVSQFDNLLNQGNLGDAFKMANIKDDDLVNFMFSSESNISAIEHRLKQHYDLMESGPQAQQMYQQHNQFAQENKTLNHQLQMANTQLAEIQQREHTNTLSAAINLHKDVADNYDQRMGAGAFMNFVQSIGNVEWNKGNRMTPEQLVPHVVNMLGISNPAQTQEQIIQPTEQPVATTPKVLPNIGGGVTESKVGKVASSLDEYRDLMRNVAV